jgi:hypothetical protein
LNQVPGSGVQDPVNIGEQGQGRVFADLLPLAVIP